MAQKKITSTIARILAEKVKAELAKSTQQIGADYKKEIEASKDYKEYLKTIKQMNALCDKKELLRKALHKTHKSNTIMNIDIWSDGKISIRAAESLSTESIRDMILLEDHFAGDETTQDDIVKAIVAKLSADITIVVKK